MERALAALASAAAPRENRGAHARISPPGEWSAILACKDVQMQDDIPSRLGSVLLDTPMTTPGTSSRRRPPRLVPERRRRNWARQGDLEAHLPGGANQGPFLVQPLSSAGAG